MRVTRVARERKRQGCMEEREKRVKRRYYGNGKKQGRGKYGGDKTINVEDETKSEKGNLVREREKKNEISGVSLRLKYRGRNGGENKEEEDRKCTAWRESAFLGSK